MSAQIIPFEPLEEIDVKIPWHLFRRVALATDHDPRKVRRFVRAALEEAMADVRGKAG